MPLVTVMIIAGFVVVVFGWMNTQPRWTGRRPWHPLWTAFTLTAVALLYGVGGLLGYVIPQHNPFIDRAPTWVGTVVWPQVGWASVALLLSLPFWWYGLKRLAREDVR